MKIKFHPTVRRVFGIVVMLSLSTGAAVAQPATDFARDPAFEAAHANYERNHWPEAYAAFAVLADRGHAEAARIALQMLKRGPTLYGTTFEADAEQRQRWTWLASCISGIGRKDCGSVAIGPRRE